MKRPGPILLPYKPFPYPSFISTYHVEYDPIMLRGSTLLAILAITRAMLHLLKGFDRSYQFSHTSLVTGIPLYKTMGPFTATSCSQQFEKSVVSNLASHSQQFGES